MAIRIDPVEAELDRRLSQLKVTHADAVGDANELQVALSPFLQHEALRIAQKLGPEHSRSRQLRARLESNREAIQRLGEEHEISQVNVPDVTAESTLIHGRVVDESRRGIAKLRVRLVDRDDRPVGEDDASETEDTGYYAIALAPEMVDELREASKEVSVGVFNERGRLIFRDPKPLAFDRGARVLRGVNLDRGEVARGSEPPTAPQLVCVPDLLGSTEEEALQRVKDAGLRLRETERGSAADDTARVLSQEPTAGASVPRGSAIDVVFGVAEDVEVPRLVRCRLETARKRLQASGLTVGSVDMDPQGRTGIVVRQEPSAGATVPAGTRVNLVVGRVGSPR